ncbi:MAG: hypothetical protein ACK53Y_16005, partial [bacterium]
LQKPRKPPVKAIEKLQYSGSSYIACSSMMNDVSNVKDIYTESHDSDDSVIIGLDSLCSRHLFPAKSDFISEIQPIEPFDIHGIGGNIQAIGQGTVQVRFRDPSGLLH